MLDRGALVSSTKHFNLIMIVDDQQSLIGTIDRFSCCDRGVQSLIFHAHCTYSNFILVLQGLYLESYKCIFYITVHFRCGTLVTRVALLEQFLVSVLADGMSCVLFSNTLHLVSV